MVTSLIRGVFTATFAVINTIAWGIPFYVVAAARLVWPAKGWKTHCDDALTWIAESWVATNNKMIDVVLPTRWRVEGVDGLDPTASYLVNANHQTWADILVLQRVFNRRIPFLRFFLKQELIWVPILGLAWRALYFPFMKRYTREQIARRPELAGKDLETTRRICQRLRGRSIAIINFLEGTRFTDAKHARQKSPYRYLLRPKAGGFAFVLGAIGDQLRSMLDVTIVYPDGRPTFWRFLCGRVPEIVVQVEEREIPAELIGGDYANDPRYRERVQRWVRELWTAKDARITAVLEGSRRHAA